MNPLQLFIPLAQAIHRRGGELMRGTVINSVPHLVVDDHRWMFPAIWAANRSASLKQAPLVLLDFHAELASWAEESPEHQQLLIATTIDDVLDCCQMPGRPPSEQTVHDGNWLAAAVKLGWVGPVVTIGVESPDDPTNPPGILECGRINARLFRNDARWMERRHRANHEAIGWHLSDDALAFTDPPRNLYLTVDLDAFAEGGDDGEGMKRRRERDLTRSLTEPYKSGLARGCSFHETYSAWLRKTSFVLIAMETEMFIGWGRRRQCERAESLLRSFWTLLYGSVPDLLNLNE